MAYDFDPLANIAAASVGTRLPKPAAVPQISMSSANDGGDDMTPDHTINIGYDGRISDPSTWPENPFWNAARAASELAGSLIATPMANNPAMAYLTAGLPILGAGMARPNTLREASQGGRAYPTHMASEEPLAFALEGGPASYPRLQPNARNTTTSNGYSQTSPLEGGPYMSAPSMRKLQADLQHAVRTAGVPAQETMAAGDTVTYFPHGTYDGVMDAVGEMSVGDAQRLDYISRYGTPGYTKALTPTEFNAARDSLDAMRDGARVDARGRGLATAPEGVPRFDRVADEKARLEALYRDDPAAFNKAYMDFIDRIYGY